MTFDCRAVALVAVLPMVASAVPKEDYAEPYRILQQANRPLDPQETQRGSEEMRHVLSARSMRALDAINDRLESPAARLLRHVEVRSSYLVLPIFAFANAGVTISPALFEGRAELMMAIAAGLILGKPIGLFGASYVAVKAGIAVKPSAYDWTQVLGAGCLAGIGFTMSLFIAGQSFPLPADFDAAKVAIFIASVLSAGMGVAVLWWAADKAEESPVASKSPRPRE